MRRTPLKTLGDLLDPQAREQVLELPEEVTHYLRDVLRLECGERVELFDGAGLLVEAKLVALRPLVRAQVCEVTHRAREREGPSITLCQAIPKGDRWEWTLEKSTELGVRAIKPILSARTVVKIAPAKQARKMQRWQGICEAAARQSGRAYVPEVLASGKLEEALEEQRDALHIVAALHRETRALGEIVKAAHDPGQAICVWAGPEGGWTPAELEVLAEHGAHFTQLGPHVLRAETAAISLVALTQYVTGAWS